MTRSHLFSPTLLVFLAAAGCSGAPGAAEPQTANDVPPVAAQAPRDGEKPAVSEPRVEPLANSTVTLAISSTPMAQLPEPVVTPSAPMDIVLTPVDEPAKSLPAGPVAPEILNETWLNSPRLTTADLRGHPVLVEFWALGCINCIRTAPAMKALHELYKDDGLIVIGVHTPEFDREKDVGTVQAAIEKLELPYPVAIDNDLATWNAFYNQYWPAIYVIDKRGVLRTTHIGELHMDSPEWGEVTGLVEQLIAEPG
jgi:thiol-disulfide isomerase/thioredoxin